MIFLLRKKKAFIILLGLSETIWTDFPSLVFLDANVGGRSCPHPNSPLQTTGRRERLSGVAREVVGSTVLLTSCVALPEWKEAVDGFDPQIPPLCGLCLKIWVPGHGVNGLRRVNIHWIHSLCQAPFLTALCLFIYSILTTT